LAGFGLVAAGDRVTGGVAGVARAGGIDSRAREATRVNNPESWRGDAQADAHAHALMGEWHGAGSRALGSRRCRLADRPGGGSARNNAKYGGNPARPTAGWYQVSLATKKGGAFGTHARRVRRNGLVEPVRRCAGVCGGGMVARYSTGEREPREKRLSG
jgi:hypothetical protein